MFVDCYPAIADVIDSPNKIQIIEKGREQIGSEISLHLKSTLEFKKSLTVAGVNSCYHITRVTPDLFWVSDEKNNLILANTSGNTFYELNDSLDDSLYGLHTVNGNSELIYIDEIILT